MYLKEFEIRWNDLDANWHLANASYVSYVSHTRMSALMDHGMDHTVLAKYGIGPVVFHEHFYYFREAVQGKVTVSFELAGASEDGKFFQFLHNFYNDEGENIAACDIKGGWIDLSSRKLISLPQELLTKFKGMPKTEDFRTLERNDMRSGAMSPKPMKL